ncbi:hypothetical protein [Ancylobacter terrae]|uniref:hypothetical protein n=1 Tax=Ancylobacter sp. sgz301288 TaxID=3342077 RepID=UPI00385DFF7D
MAKAAAKKKPAGTQTRASASPPAGKAKAAEPALYSDGSPQDEVQYLECKLILKPDRFTSAKVFFEYGKLVARTAEKFGIGFSDKGIVLNPVLREVVFLDTADFRLYNSAFILRRRIRYENGFPAGEPEVVFKFRHPDLATAATMDVRPNIAGQYRIKFKAEALPLKNEVGGLRLLYSHNVQFGLSQAPEGDRTSMAMLADVFPALAPLKAAGAERVELVNQTIVEEVLQDLGVLNFGKGVKAKANIAIWRERGTHHALCGEFAFQAKFERANQLHDKARERCKAFFIELQQAGRDWLSLGTTKTGLVYRLKGNPPQAHE